jgi:hypothetical protein
MSKLLLRTLAPLTVAAAVLGLGSLPAGATSGAHFMPATDASVTPSGALSVNIDEAGVGNALVNYTLVWTATADYGCINGGGNHPQATNKETTTAGGSDTFSESPINGRVHATVTVLGTPPPVTNGFTCPNGQTLVLADVSYSATLSDTTNDVSIGLSASATFFTFKK